MLDNLFKQHAITDMATAAEFTEWLSLQTRDNTPIAMALKGRAQKLAVASRDDAWLVDLKDPIADLAVQMIATQLRNGGLHLWLRDTASDIVEMTRRLGPRMGIADTEMLYLLIDAVVGDLTCAGACINVVVTPHTKFARVEHDAFDIALNLPQYIYSIMPYYSKVGLPMAKLVAETAVLRATGVDWWVSYPDLWVRVLTFFAHDPTLIMSFYENRDPFETVAAMFGESKDAAELRLLWAACGFDFTTFSEHFPKLVKTLPGDLITYNAQINKHLPMLFQSVNQMKEAYYQTRLAETRYARRLRPGKSLGESVFFRVFGTVEDIVALEAVAIWNNRPSRDILVTKFEGGPASNTIRISGSGPHEGGQSAWMNLLKTLAPLSEPLGQVKLFPSIVKV